MDAGCGDAEGARVGPGQHARSQPGHGAGRWQAGAVASHPAGFGPETGAAITRSHVKVSRSARRNVRPGASNDAPGRRRLGMWFGHSVTVYVDELRPMLTESDRTFTTAHRQACGPRPRQIRGAMYIVGWRPTCLLFPSRRR